MNERLTPAAVQSEFQDRVVVVTGGSRGIGFAVAGAFAREGAIVVVTAQTPERAELAAEKLRSAGGNAVGMPLRVESAQSCGDLVGAVTARLGRIDVLVNNAATFERATVAAMDEHTWRHTLDVNLTGIFLLIKAVLPGIARPGGRIINMVSGIAVTGGYASAAYAASKAGVMALTRSLGIELAGEGINVNAVSPGLIDTDMSRAAYSEDELGRFAAAMPGRQAGKPEDVAGTVLHLASAASAAMSGQTIFIRTPVPVGPPPRGSALP